MGMKPGRPKAATSRRLVSVLNREPMGMKPRRDGRQNAGTHASFSAQPRADGDEA